MRNLDIVKMSYNRHGRFWLFLLTLIYLHSYDKKVYSILRISEYKSPDEILYWIKIAIVVTRTHPQEPIAVSNIVSFTPSCTQLSLLQDIESVFDEQYVQHNRYESIKNIVDISCLNSVHIFHESILMNIITSIRLLEAHPAWSKCY